MKVTFKEENIEFKRKVIDENYDTITELMNNLEDISIEFTEDCENLFHTMDKADFAGNLLWLLLTSEETLPIATYIAQVGSLLLEPRCIDLEKKVKALTLAGEIISLLEYTEVKETFNGKLIVSSLLYSEEYALNKAIYPLPSAKPTKRHSTLGRYDFDIADSTNRTLNKLNSTGFSLTGGIKQEIVPLSAKPTPEELEKFNKQSVVDEILPVFENKEFYFNWSPDYRGRIYCGGYHLSPQGNEYDKSIMEFSEGEIITEEGFRQIKMSMASAFGKDKLNDEDKLNWYENNKDNLNPLEAKERFTAEKLLIAIDDYNSGVKSGITLGHDATCSQLQVVSAFFGDRQTAELTNLVLDDENADVIADVYGTVAEAMTLISS